MGTVINVKIKLLPHEYTISIPLPIDLFKFNNQYVILVNTNIELAPYIARVRRLLSERSKDMAGLKSVVMLQGRGLSDKLDGDVNVLLITDRESYSESTDEAMEGRKIKTITVGAVTFCEMFRNITPEMLASRGLILYGDEFLKGLNLDERP